MNINELKGIFFDFDMTLLQHPENYLMLRDEDDFLYRSYIKEYDYDGSIVTESMRQFVTSCDAVKTAELFMFSAASSNYVLDNKQRVVLNRYPGVHWRKFLSCYSPVAKADTLAVFARHRNWKPEEICLIDDAEEVRIHAEQRGFKTIDATKINAGKCYVAMDGTVVLL